MFIFSPGGARPGKGGSLQDRSSLEMIKIKMCSQLKTNIPVWQGVWDLFLEMIKHVPLQLKTNTAACHDRSTWVTPEK